MSGSEPIPEPEFPAIGQYEIVPGPGDEGYEPPAEILEIVEDESEAEPIGDADDADDADDDDGGDDMVELIEEGDLP